MIPNHVLTEIQNRVDETIASSLGIDIDASLSPLPSAEEASAELLTHHLKGVVLRGAVPFDLQLTALGKAATSHCRAVYAVTLGEDKRIEGLVMKHQVLTWEDNDEHGRQPFPHWEDTDIHHLLSPAMREQIDALIEKSARQSNS